MPISKAVISKKLDFLNEQISKIKQMDFDGKSFVKDEDIHDLVIFRLQQGVETCIDIAAHVLAGMDVSQKETAKDAFNFLGEKGIIDKKLAFKMGKAADFRNRVVHGYNDFDFHLLFDDYQGNIKDLQQFGSEILKYLESS